MKRAEEAVLPGHTDVVYCLIMTHDKNFIVSGSVDMTIRIRNIFERTQEAVLEGHESVVTTLAVTIDNQYVISGAADNTIRI